MFGVTQARQADTRPESDVHEVAADDRDGSLDHRLRLP